ncbi:hypothetical protein ES703_64934 [subsurface metagenome]
MKIERFEDIEVWQPVESLKVERLARELTRKVYRLTKKPGFARDYGLKRQIQDNFSGSQFQGSSLPWCDASCAL